MRQRLRQKKRSGVHSRVMNRAEEMLGRTCFDV